jgi:hypothetical protein
MSLYNILFGTNPMSDILLKCLGLTKGEVPRFRDCFLQDNEIVIHTRTGGDNREEYSKENDKLCEIKNYLRDEDDEFDCTYANFYYSFPQEYAEDLQAISEENQDYAPSEKWKMLFNAMSDKKNDHLPKL